MADRRAVISDEPKIIKENPTEEDFLNYVGKVVGVTTYVEHIGNGPVKFDYRGYVGLDEENKPWLCDLAGMDGRIHRNPRFPLGGKNTLVEAAFPMDVVESKHNLGSKRDEGARIEYGVRNGGDHLDRYNLRPS